MRDLASKALYAQWLALWNGDSALASEIIAPDCVVHQAPFGVGEPPTYWGPEGIIRMIEQGRAPFSQIVFRLDVGPIVSGSFVAARWEATGTYQGGVPGATAPAGQAISFHGHDILRLEDGQIVEYWVSSDGAYLMAQLGMLDGSGES